MGGYYFWVLSALYAAIPFSVSCAYEVVGEQPGPIMWLYEKWVLGLAVMFFVFGCVAEAA